MKLQCDLENREHFKLFWNIYCVATSEVRDQSVKGHNSCYTVQLSVTMYLAPCCLIRKVNVVFII